LAKEPENTDRVETTTTARLDLGVVNLKRQTKRTKAGRFAAGCAPGPGRPRKSAQHAAGDAAGDAQNTIADFIRAANHHAATIEAATQSIRALGNEPTRQAVLDRYTRRRASQVLTATKFHALRLPQVLDRLAEILIEEVADVPTSQRILARIDALIDEIRKQTGA
jgi:hypothetical protein